MIISKTFGWFQLVFVFIPYFILLLAVSCVLLLMLYLSSKNSTYQKYSLWQNIADKFKKLSKTGFSMECFTAAFLQISSAHVKVGLLSDWLGTWHQFQAFQRFYWNLLLSLLRYLETRGETCIFTFWWQ